MGVKGRRIIDFWTTFVVNKGVSTKTLLRKMQISYTNPVLREFEREIAPYKSGKFNSFNMDRYLLEKGIYAAQEEGYPPALVETRLGDYMAFQAKFEALCKLQRQTSYAKTRNLAELAPEIPKEKETSAEKRHRERMETLEEQGYVFDTTQSPPRWVKKEIA